MINFIKYHYFISKSLQKKNDVSALRLESLRGTKAFLISETPCTERVKCVLFFFFIDLSFDFSGRDSRQNNNGAIIIADVQRDNIIPCNISIQ